MNISNTLLRMAALATVLLTLAPLHAEVPRVPVPEIDGAWWQVAGDPNLASWTTSGQQPVDFGIWQAGDGTWQIWSCIRGTAVGGNTRLFYGWEGQNITDSDWTPAGIKWTARPDLGETPGGMQAPHVVEFDGLYHMAYGDWVNICHATSEDGKNFTRVIQPGGKTGMFTEGAGNNSRDPMALFTGGMWSMYYCAHPFGNTVDYLRTSTDWKTWSPSRVVAGFGSAGTGIGNAECPFVVEHPAGHYYLFRTQAYGQNNISRVYYSTDPTYFGVNHDHDYLLTSLSAAAPEIVFHEGQWYIAALMPSLKGIRIAKLKWTEGPTTLVKGESLFDLDDPDVRAEWSLFSGNLASVFTNSTRTNFSPYYDWFIATSEVGNNTLDDDRTGVILSPTFEIQHDAYILLIAGGNGANNRYVQIVDAGTDAELVRWTGYDSNVFRDELWDASEHVGQTVKIRVVDTATGAWGHINWGGMFVAEEEPTPTPSPTPSDTPTQTFSWTPTETSTLTPTWSWTPTETAPPWRRSDLNGDGAVDYSDLLIFQGDWLR